MHPIKGARNGLVAIIHTWLGFVEAPSGGNKLQGGCEKNCEEALGKLL